MSSISEDILNELAEKDFIVFAGAGVVLSAGVPSWKTLLERLINETRKSINLKGVDTEEYPIIAQKIFNHFKEEGRENEYYDIIENIIQPTVAKCTYPQLKIAEVTNWIITTNFDKSFEDAFEELSKFKNKPIEIYKEILPDFNYTNHFHHPTVIYLHGKTNVHHIIFKKEDYEQYYPSVNGNKEGSTYLENYLRYLYENYTIVFVGFGFEFFIRETFRKIYKDIEKSDKVASGRLGYVPKLDKIKHYYFLKVSKDGSQRYQQQQLISILESIRIKVIKIDEHIDWVTCFERICDMRRPVEPMEVKYEG